jgi:hypothetical protein
MLRWRAHCPGACRQSDKNNKCWLWYGHDDRWPHELPEHAAAERARRPSRTPTGSSAAALPRPRHGHRVVERALHVVVGAGDRRPRWRVRRWNGNACDHFPFLDWSIERQCMWPFSCPTLLCTPYLILSANQVFPCLPSLGSSSYAFVRAAVMLFRKIFWQISFLSWQITLRWKCLMCPGA